MTALAEEPVMLAESGSGVEAVEELSTFLGDPAWLCERRLSAWQQWQDLPMPTRRDERWRFTNLRGIDFASVPTLDHGTVANYGNVTLPEGAIFLPMVEAIAQHPELVQQYLGSVVSVTDSVDDKFVAMNDALWSSGAFIYVPRNTKVEMPLSVELDLAAAAQWRMLVVLEEGAEATLVERFASQEGLSEGFNNAVVELVVGNGAHLTYVTEQVTGHNVAHFATHRVNAARDAQVEWIAVGLGSGRGKSRMEAHMQGAGSNVRLTGAYVLDGVQQIDYDTRQVHQAPNATSDLAFKGVLADKSRAVWRGTIDVEDGAQGTDSYQDNRNLLLSRGAHADSIPGLQIEANDVRCTHGATISKVDAEQLFYLMARGFTREQATREIVRGFFVSVFDRIPEGPVRDSVRDMVWSRLDAISAV